jgi:hypothetical protein
MGKFCLQKPEPDAKCPDTPKYASYATGDAPIIAMLFSFLVLSTEPAFQPALSLFLRWRHCRCFRCELLCGGRRTIQLDWHAWVIGWGRRNWAVAILHASVPIRWRIEVLHQRIPVLHGLRRTSVGCDRRIGSIAAHLRSFITVLSWLPIRLNMIGGAIHRARVCGLCILFGARGRGLVGNVI